MNLIKSIGLHQNALHAAPDLLGCELVRKYNGQVLRVRIVETEAYREDDPASHSFQGATNRSAVMFGFPGTWYMYKCYGIHWMINVVSGPEGTGEAILIRAAEPIQGRSTMIDNRNKKGAVLTNGPGKLAEALQVDNRFNSRSVEASSESNSSQTEADDLYLIESRKNREIFTSPRVGISQARERHWRFFIESEFLSDVEQNEKARRYN